MNPPIGTILFGVALAIDGDTLSMESYRLHLFGIDAPEAAQHCIKEGVPYPCGAEATAFLAGLVAGQQVICTVRGHEPEQALANCVVGGRDLAALLVEAGWALALPQTSRQYVAYEEQARAAQRGVWQGSIEAPWEWRQKRK